MKNQAEENRLSITCSIEAICIYKLQSSAIGIDEKKRQKSHGNVKPETSIVFESDIASEPVESLVWRLDQRSAVQSSDQERDSQE